MNGPSGRFSSPVTRQRTPAKKREMNRTPRAQNRPKASVGPLPKNTTGQPMAPMIPVQA